MGRIFIPPSADRTWFTIGSMATPDPWLELAKEKPQMKTIDWNKPLEYVPNPAGIRVVDTKLHSGSGLRVVMTVGVDDETYRSTFYLDEYGRSHGALCVRNKVETFTRFDILGVDGRLNWFPGGQLRNMKEYAPKTRDAAERRQAGAGDNWKNGTIVEMTWEE